MGTSFFEQLWTSTKDSTMTALDSAKTKLLTDLGNKIVARPDVQAAAKEGAGNKVGNWLLDNWKIVLGIGLVGLVVTIWIARK